MPFLTYGVSVEETLDHAGAFLQDGGAQAVKVEGGVRSARTIEALVKAGIPVMGHIGLTPQASQPDRQGPGPGQDPRGSARPARRRAGGPGGGRLRDRPGAGARAARRGHHRAPAHPDHRHRRRGRLRRPGPGHHRRARAWASSCRVTHARTRTCARRSTRPSAAWAADVAAGTFPGEAEIRAHGRRRARRRARAGRPRPPRRAIRVGAARPARARTSWAASRSTATSRSVTRVLRTRAELRAALADAPRPVGLVPTMGWLHDGHRALMRRAPRRRRHDGRDDLRQPAPVRRGGRLPALSAQRGPRPGHLRRGQASTSSGHRRSRRSIRRASTRSSASARWPLRWRAPRDRATSTGWPRWWPSSSRWSAPSTPTSARRTRSRSWSSGGWPATWPCRPRSSPAPPCASRTALRSRRATSTSRRPSVRGPGPPPRAAGRAASAGSPASGRRMPCVSGCGRSSPTERLADVEYVSCADGLTLRELDRVEGPALLSARCPLRRRRGSSTTSS